MSRLHFSENLFIDNLELRKFSNFIFENGWEEIVKNKIGSFGVLKNTKLDTNFSNFQITQGNPINGEPTIVVANGYAVGYNTPTKSLKIIKNEWNQPIIFPQNGKYYWVKIEAEENVLESGVVNIDTDGNMVGSGTKFTDVLRGQPDFPQVVRFYRVDKTDNYSKLQSALNPLEYTVAQVIDDQTAILQGDFNNENSLYYEVVGTFTPGFIVDELDKGVYRYDGCKISLVEEVSATGYPLKPFHVLNEEFFIYRIKFESGQMIIEDFRNELFKIDGEFDIEYISNAPIPNIGLTKVEFSLGATKETNIATVEWGFNSTSYDVFINDKKVTITSGNGGKYKTANDFQNGDFNGYRLYVLDTVKNETDDDYYSSFEKLFKIKTSQKNGTAIDLFLENFSPLDFIPENYSSAVNYTNKNKVTTTSGTYRLVVDALTGVSPVQPVWNTGTIYSVNQFVTFLGGTYRSLQNTNSGNSPDTTPLYWKKVWEQYKPKIVVVPDCEEICLYASIGTDTVGFESTDPCNCQVGNVIQKDDRYTIEQFFPVIFGKAQMSLIAINAQASTKQDDLVYNIQYRTKNNKAFSTRKVFPSDAVGYTDELGTVVPYDTTLVDDAFVKSIRSSDSYQDFRDRIDLGDKLGWEVISNLETFAATFPSRIIPIAVGVNKQRIIITNSAKLTADLWIDLSLVKAKSGNDFEFHFLNPIDESSQYLVKFIQDGQTGTILYSIGSNLRSGDQILRVKYDSDAGLWNIIKENNAFRGYNHFTPGPTVVLNTTDNTEVAPDGKRTLVLEGDENVVILNDDGNYGEIAYIRFKNLQPINELYIAKLDGSTNINLIKDGAEARDNFAITGNPDLFAFCSNPSDGTDGTYFAVLDNSRMLHLVIGRKHWSADRLQGYNLVADSNVRSEVQSINTQIANQATYQSLGIGGDFPYIDGSGWPGENGIFNHTQNSILSNGKKYLMQVIVKFRVSSSDYPIGDRLTFISKLYFDGVQVDIIETGWSVYAATVASLQTEHVLIYTAVVNANGQKLKITTQQTSTTGTTNFVINSLKNEIVYIPVL